MYLVGIIKHLITVIYKNYDLLIFLAAQSIMIDNTLSSTVYDDN